MVASYRAYDKTNEDQDRDILKDLSGNGHDIQLYNFAFSEGSGYGLYATDFTKWKNSRADLVTKNKFVFTKTTAGSAFVIALKDNPILNSFRIKVSGFTGDKDFVYYRYYEEGNLKNYKIETNGIHTLPASDGTSEIGFLSYNIQSEITIEQIPEYQRALVSDGVDDYGYADNFPVLTKEKGYTVCAIRKNLNTDLFGTFLSKRMSGNAKDGAFSVERKVSYSGGYFSTESFGNSTEITSVYNSDLSFISQTTEKYLSYNVSVGEVEDSNYLYLFSGYKGLLELSSIALYALEIYNRDLTDEEIAKVKARMIAEYEEKNRE